MAKHNKAGIVYSPNCIAKSLPAAPTGELPDKPFGDLTKADFDAAFGPGQCMHREGRQMLLHDGDRFRCPDCGMVFDAPPVRRGGEGCQAFLARVNTEQGVP